jgi:hypothetical protein
VVKLPPIDKHVLTVSEVCLLLGVSHQTVIRRFEKEAGTLIKNFPETMHKRGRRTIRIPRAVYERVVRRLSVKLLPFVLILGLAALTGCESEQDRAKLDADIQHAHDVGQAQIAYLQWQIDDEVASRIFDDQTKVGLNLYLTFRKCHESPPTHEANWKTCAALQAHVAAKEAKDKAREAKERAAW